MKLYLIFLCKMFGKIFVLDRYYKYSIIVKPKIILSLLGAKIGVNVNIESGLRIQNAKNGDCSNLKIGNKVYIGPECLFDLASNITLEDEVVLSARVNIITHSDPGDRLLKNRFPRKEGPVIIQKGSWIGVNSTILHSVNIGKCAMVGAMSLVTKNIEDNTLSYGIPCRMIKIFED